MSDHTPGPWIARHQTGKKDGFIQKTGWVHIEVGNEAGDRFHKGVAQLHNISEADLKLISAAPDMLEALKAEEAWRESIGLSSAHCDTLRAKACDLRIAAIKKAEGRKS